MPGLGAVGHWAASRGRIAAQMLMGGAGAGAAIILLWSEPAGPLMAGCAALWWIAVMVVVKSDLKRFIIPDEATAAIAALGLVYAGLEPWQAGLSVLETTVNVAAAASMGISAFAVFWTVARIFARLSGHEGLGFGDIKLAGASALWLPPADAAMALEIAALAGLAILLWRRHQGDLRTAALPFGAFLAPAAWLTFVIGPILHRSSDLV